MGTESEKGARRKIFGPQHSKLKFESGPTSPRPNLQRYGHTEIGTDEAKPPKNIERPKPAMLKSRPISIKDGMEVGLMESEAKSVGHLSIGGGVKIAFCSPQKIVFS